MLTHINCIALHTVKYSDRNNILAVYSREFGRMSLLVSAGNGKEARRRRAMMMPGSIFECIADMRPGREIVSVNDVRPLKVFTSLHVNPAKIAVMMYVAEFLGCVLRESQPDSHLFAFLTNALSRLDSTGDRGTANFLPVFLFKLTRFLGIEPDTSTFREGRAFDMAEGQFISGAPLHGHFLDVGESPWLILVSRLSWETMERLKMSRHARRRALDVAMEYYSLHYASLSGMNSPAILMQLF